MSLGGLVLALGRLVDDSIVVMENIFRHRNLGKDAFNAASEGTSEVAVAVISSTLVTVIVFLPILYVKGIAAELFKEFGLAVFYSLMGSLLVAFTMVPMLASKLFKAGIKFEGEKEEGVYYRIKEIYGKILEWALTNKSKVISIAVIVLFITGILFIKTGKEFLSGIAGGKYQIKLKLPVGAPLEETSRMVEKIEEKILKLPDINKLSVSVGSSAMGERQAAMTGMMQGSNNATLFLVLNKKIG